MKKIKSVKAVGTGVLVALLSSEEAAGTSLYIGKNQDAPPQGYVIDIGPAMNRKDWGLEIGDRVLLHGNYTLIPNYVVDDRKVGIVEPYSIKAVLEEKDED